MQKTVVVTGGSRGIGLGITKALITAGYNVIVVARKISPELSSVRLEFGIGIKSFPLMFQAWDLAETASLDTLSHDLRQRFGGIYGLINNAGIGLSGIHSMTPDAKIEAIMRMNILSPVLLTKYLVRPMMVARAGRIINISSIVASTGYQGLATYSATKAAMIGFTRSLAREVGPLGITVNAVAPGFIDTEMTHGLDDKQRGQIARRSAMQRMTTVNDVANAVVFLMSDQAENITGTVMTVDAGNTA
jgi:3-oxoacyl-[acyl-carrier protein] reductase